MPPSWWYVPSRAVRRFIDQDFVDFVGSLAFRALLALFPGLIALVSILALFGQSEESVVRLLNQFEGVTPEDTWESVRPVLESILRAPQAGLGLVIGLVTTLWTASGFIKTFSRTMNAVYGISEGRGVFKWNLQMYLLTAMFLLLAAVGLIGSVVAGPVAEAVGELIHLETAVITVWRYVRWVLVIGVVVLGVGMLYRITPNVRLRRTWGGRHFPWYLFWMRWFTVGATIAIVATVLATALFFLYVSKAGSFNATYGALAGVVVLMLWLFLVNASLVFGALIDSEVVRMRQLRAGLPAEENLQLRVRDSSASEKRESKMARDVERAREMRANTESGEESSD
ncbi:YihY/virulence factor BrkB family protein [Corynebacterium variabile]|uniref:YihY/virulence factor BrkB family protein n=1 Tax=Corynebacterium variabile TaxID=1727 RepID=UPI001DBA3530|nr:YihY/virulence factor BrkB family protein [Corynebacterium variabile]HJG45639.1 YihY/virulence factor BrkB family protein [Corynebacterium variabile]